MELSEKGYYIQPTIIKDVERDATIAQEEIFPDLFLLVRKSKNFDDGLRDC